MPCGGETSATDHRSRWLRECLPGVGLSGATAIRLALAMGCPERVGRRIRSAACRLPMTVIMAVAMPAVALWLTLAGERELARPRVRSAGTG